MDDQTLIGYGFLAVLVLAAGRLGASYGRRFIRRDQPCWIPHVPPQRVAEPNSAIDLLAATIVVVPWAFGLANVVSELFSRSSSPSNHALLEFGALTLMLALAGYGSFSWTTANYRTAVHRHRYATDPVYRAEYERRMAELRREAKKRAKEALEQSSEETSDSISLGAAGVEPYASMYTIQ